MMQDPKLKRMSAQQNTILPNPWSEVIQQEKDRDFRAPSLPSTVMLNNEMTNSANAVRRNQSGQFKFKGLQMVDEKGAS